IRDRNVTGVQTCALPIWTLARPTHRRTVRPARELRDQHRRRPRAHLLGAPTTTGPQPAPPVRHRGRPGGPDRVAASRPRPPRTRHQHRSESRHTRTTAKTHTYYAAI